MKRYAERPTKLVDGRTSQPRNGYLAPCPRCGLIVVHGCRSRKPFHMHRRSKLCEDLAATR